MGEDEDDKKPETSAKKVVAAVPRYFQSLLFVFILPFLLLLRTILKNVQKKPFFITLAIVCVLGWAWSILLSYKHWWEFPGHFLLGIYPLPHLPLEEFLIYPLGGAFSIFFYTYPAIRISHKSGPAAYWAALLIGTSVFLALGLAYRDLGPYYIYSQLILYNGCCLLLAPWVATQINIKAIALSVACLGSIGFVWDYFAFRYGWWVYHAIMDLRILNIPIEDVNFYMFAPIAAVSFYLVLCKLLGIPPLPKNS